MTTTSSLTLGPLFRGLATAPAAARVVRREADQRPLVEEKAPSPFARHPFGAPLAWRERVGILALLLWAASLVVVVLVRADGTWNGGAASSTPSSLVQRHL